LLAGGQKLFAVIKADAYGHGAVQVAGALEFVDGFAVVTLAEALELREAAIKQPILVLQGAQEQSECNAFHEFDLWPLIHCAEQLSWFNNSQHVAKLRPWIEIDTGMGRLGFQPIDALAAIAGNQAMNWMGAITHFASADEPQSHQTQSQMTLFASTVASLKNQQPGLISSLANSAGVLAWPDSQADWARPGIMLYGANPLCEGFDIEPAPLRSAMRVSAPVISKKMFNAGDCIGYSATYICEESMPVGFLGIGYGDGLPRVFDQSASVSLHGQRCPIIGRVSMDSIAIDLRNVPTVQLGDHAVLWGDEQPVAILARAANTISYELMTSIKGPREYL